MFDSSTATKIEKACEKYRCQKGTLYKTIQEMSNRLYPSVDDFIDYCFGEPDDGHLIYHFDGIKGTNKNVTKRLYDLFTSFEWVDRFNQEAFEVADCGNFFLFGHCCW